MDIFVVLEVLELRRKVATFLPPSSWDKAAPVCKAFSSLAKVHNTSFYFPGEIPATSYPVDK
jgi:hypothetical protein